MNGFNYICRISVKWWCTYKIIQFMVILWWNIGTIHRIMAIPIWCFLLLRFPPQITSDKTWAVFKSTLGQDYRWISSLLPLQHCCCVLCILLEHAFDNNTVKANYLFIIFYLIKLMVKRVPIKKTMACWPGDFITDDESSYFFHNNNLMAVTSQL